MDDKNDEIARLFDDHEAKYSESINNSLRFTGLQVGFFTTIKASYIEDIVKQSLGSPASTRLLDIGCGVGNIHPRLEPHFASIDGVDISLASIERARENNPDVNYTCYDGAKLPFEDDTFDVAFTICVMHHVPPEAWPNFAREMHRVIRPGGLALVFEHNPMNPLSLHVVNNCEFDKDAVLLRPSTTQKLLAGAGFDEIWARSIITIPPPGKLLRSVDRLFSLLPLGAQYYVAARKGGAEPSPASGRVGRLLEAWRFSLVGLAATLVYFGAANLLIFALMIDARLASLAAYVLGMVVSFFGQSYYTFRVSRATTFHATKFCLTSLLGLSVSYGSIVLVQECGVHLFWGTVATVVLVPIISYIAMRTWVFSTAETPEASETPATEQAHCG